MAFCETEPSGSRLAPRVMPLAGRKRRLALCESRRVFGKRLRMATRPSLDRWRASYGRTSARSRRRHPGSSSHRQIIAMGCYMPVSGRARPVTFETGSLVTLSHSFPCVASPSGSAGVRCRDQLHPAVQLRSKVVRSFSAVSTTKTARSLAGTVALVFSLRR